jgi:hypothetical protein
MKTIYSFSQRSIILKKGIAARIIADIAPTPKKLVIQREAEFHLSKGR